MSYNNLWTENLTTPEDKQRFHNQLYGSQDVLQRLSSLINVKLEQLEASERTMGAYENPNWAYLQAHRNGYHSAMKIITNLITLDPREK